MTALVIDILVMAPTITYRHNMAGKAMDDGGKGAGGGLNSIYIWLSRISVNQYCWFKK